MTEPSGSGIIESVQWRDKSAVVSIAGDIDLNCSVEFQQELLLLVDEKPTALIIDLSSVPYMDSSGVASLVKLLSRTKKGGISLKLAALTDRVRSIFEITRLDSVFDIRATVEEAMS